MSLSALSPKHLRLVVRVVLYNQDSVWVPPAVAHAPQLVVLLLASLWHSCSFALVHALSLLLFTMERRSL